MKRNYKTMGAAAAMIVALNVQVHAVDLLKNNDLEGLNAVNVYDYEKWTSEEVYKKIVEILHDKLQCDINKIKPEARLMKDLGADSLDFLEIIEACCEEFGCGVTEKEYNSIETVEDLHCVMINAIRRAEGMSK